ncbi:MepB family protein [Haploplasma axanthum]|nr:MepB family protein [Haploplasma axanthum]
MKSIEIIKNVFSDYKLLFNENNNSDYEGFVFESLNRTYRSRLCKKTPKKVGYFVAIWEKDSNNKNTAFSSEDNVDAYIINIIDENRKGYFLFPKDILISKKILKDKNQNGKMAFRVYPSWINELNDTAKKTKEWQNKYFIDLSNN